MNAIIGMTAIGMSSEGVEGKDYAFDKINSASKHLLGGINDILDMSKIEANKLELSPVPFDFEKMLKDVVNIVNFRVDERKQKLYVNIDKNIPRALVGDDQRFAQVITNLLSNAAKFTPEDGSIHLDTRLLSEENGVCRIQTEVRDTGIGMNEEQKARLFKSFEQAEAGTARKYGGTGLGLAISKRIVDLMGGEIWAESEPGRGSTFTFTVSLKRGREDALPAEEETPPQTAEPDDFKGRVILLAEDMEINREIVVAMLAPTGVTVDCAEDGSEALKKYGEAQERYDMIFMDVQMPDMDGYEATRRIRALGVPRAKEVPIIAMTANVFREDIEECLAAGMNAHVGKPLNIEELLAVMKRYL
jgi:CheY-like chemotaxis protein/two-component sensor histidine kinase